MDRAESLELLKANHSFPGAFQFRVVVRAGATAGVVSAIGATVDHIVDVTETPSRKGTYVSVRVQAQVLSAESVLDTYGTLAQLDEVIATL